MDVEFKLGAAGFLVILVLLYTIIKPAWQDAGETYIQVDDLHLAEDASYDPGSRQTSPSVTLKFIESPRTFKVPHAYLPCVNHLAITNNFEKGAVASIALTETDYNAFKESHWYSYQSTLYGLSKDNVQFLSSSCRHQKESEASNQIMVTSLITGLVIIALIAYISLNENGTARLEHFPLGPFLATVFLITLLACRFFW